MLMKCEMDADEIPIPLASILYFTGMYFSALKKMTRRGAPFPLKTSPVFLNKRNLSGV